MSVELRDPPAGIGNVRALLRLGGFRRLAGTRLLSQFGDGLFQTALGGSVLFNPAQESSPIKIATGFAILLIPFSLVGPFAGVFLDRWSRRNILYLANAVRALLAIPGAILVATDGPGIGFFTCALLIAATNRFFLAGLSAAAPHVVPEPLLVTNNATASTLGTLVYSLGIGASAIALHFLPDGNPGYGFLAGAGAIAYLVASLLARVSFAAGDLGPDRAIAGSGSVGSEIGMVARGMLAGAKHLIERRPVALAMGVQATCRLLYGVLSLATLLLYTRYFFHNYSSALGGLGQIVVVGSFGAVAAAFITPVATRSIGSRTWVVAMAALPAVILPPLALPFIPLLLVVATFLMNLSSQGIKIVVDTNVQLYCDENFRGRVFSVEDTLFNVLFVVGLFVAAITLPADGHSVTTIVTIAAGYLVIAGGYAAATAGSPLLVRA